MKRALRTLAVVFGVVVFGICCYLAGVYSAARSDVGLQIFEAVGTDLRPDPIDATELERLVNAERVQLNMSELPHSDLLTASACLKLDDMAAKNYWAHTSPDGTEPWTFFQQADYSYRNAGENLAYGQLSADMVVSQWMASPGHRANIVGDYREQGICSKVVKFQGGYRNLMVHHFGTPY